MNNIVELHPANKERVDQIRAWFNDQAASKADPVAILNLTITATRGAHRMKSSVLGVEPIHAMILLDEIDRIRAELCAYFVESGVNELDRSLSGNVVPLR